VFATLKAIAVFAVTLSGSHVYAVLVLPNLPAGTQYRLAFVTSGVRDATSSNIADYNTFVTTEANAQPDLAALSTTWTAIGSTFTVDARINTMTDWTPPDDTGVPIFRVDGVKVADHYDDLWDGSIDSFLNVTQSGSTKNDSVWTGTAIDGTNNSILYLGSSSPTIGLSNSQTASWTMGGFDFSSSVYSFYGISGVLTAVPEPKAFVCVGLISIVVGITFVCRKSLKHD
jgi:hypothetical protein